MAKKLVQLTMLNVMAGTDFELAARRQAGLDLKWLDLKDEIWAKPSMTSA